MARPAVFTFQPHVNNQVALIQTTTSVVFNGVLANQSNQDFSYVTLSGFQRPVVLTSTQNLSAISITVAGSTYSSLAVSETLSGPNNNSVTTTQAFMTVNSITSPSTMTSIRVGFDTTGTSRPFIPNAYNTPADIGMQVNVSGTINYTVQSTYDDVQKPGTQTWFSSATMSGTASSQGSYTVPPKAIRIVVNSAGNTGGLTFIVNPTGV